MTLLLDALKKEAAKPPRQVTTPAKDARDMTDAEYATAKAAAIENARVMQQKANADRQLAAITKKFGKDHKP